MVEMVHVGDFLSLLPRRPPMSFEELSPAERLIAEHAVLKLRTLNNVYDMASDGTVLAIAEGLVVKQGHELTRKTLQMSVDAQVKTVEKKFAHPDLPHCTTQVFGKKKERLCLEAEYVPGE